MAEIKTTKAVEDTLYVIGGKWKLLILHTLCFEAKRFNEICRDIGITPRMLSREIKEMEINMLVERIVYDERPPKVEYKMTDYGHTLEPLIAEMIKWGRNHRKRIIKK